MAALDTQSKLAILADAAKYDASCASSGTTKRNSRDGKGIGSTESSGICHAYAPDGRCISLLKVLMTNFCIYDCQFCINRKSSNVARARFAPQEVVDLFMSFYRRNYVEGLFLSSGIIQNSDYTMEQMIKIVQKLREEENFRGYIHLKTIPDASAELIEKAGLYADRLSINIELPTDAGIKTITPEKDGDRIRADMGVLKGAIDDGHDAMKKFKSAPKFAPGGQSTQMIIGADAADDRTIIGAAAGLYDQFRMRRVYYSAFSPIPDPHKALAGGKPELVREHRIYQSDWLMRLYGFTVADVQSAADDVTGMLPLDVDPKTAWALKNRHLFPMDVNKATKEMLVRIPGMGTTTASGVVATRRHRTLRLADLAALTKTWKRLKPWIVCGDWTPGSILDADDLGKRLAVKSEQLQLL
jgi:putative DNA modification/repair radical SAM protein